jgi:hypothetical protein
VSIRRAVVRPVSGGLLAVELQFGAKSIAVRDRPTILRAGEDGSLKAIAELLA